MVDPFINPRRNSMATRTKAILASATAAELKQALAIKQKYEKLEKEYEQRAKPPE